MGRCFTVQLAMHVENVYKPRSAQLHHLFVQYIADMQSGTVLNKKPSVKFLKAPMVQYLRHEVHTPLPLLLLQLQRNPSHRTPLDSFHQVGHKAGNLVTHTLGWDNGHLVTHTLIGVEVHRETRIVLLDDGSRRFLHRLRANTLWEKGTRAQLKRDVCRKAIEAQLIMR